MPDLTVFWQDVVLGPLVRARDLLVRVAKTDDPCVYETAVWHIAEAIAILGSIDPDEAVAAERQWVVKHLSDDVVKALDTFNEAVRADDYDAATVEQRLDELMDALAREVGRVPVNEIGPVLRMIGHYGPLLEQLQALSAEERG